MAAVRTESRCRIGITWYATEAEAEDVASKLVAHYGPGALAAANLGFAQCGRARAHDRPGEYAVITP